MAYTLHGFVVINDLIDNTPGETSILGELSSYSATYSIEKGYYTLENIPRIRLVSFRSRQDDADVTVPANIQKNCIELTSWLSQQAISGNFINNKEIVYQAIFANYKTTLSKIKIGKIVRGSNNMYLPEWIEFTVTAESENKIKLWFSDKSFKQQYPFYDIKVIPAFKNLDAYFGSRDEVRALQVSIPDIHQERNRTFDSKQSGETLVITHMYDWHDPQDPTFKISFPWTVLIYGGIGENLDIIKDATVDYVLKNSAYDRQRWEQIFPDLFVPTEYIFSPFWYNYSLPNKQLIAGEFSPIMSLGKIIPHAKKTFIGYDESHLTKNLQVTTHLYRSLSMAVCGHMQNRLGPVKFSEKWPEYCLIRSVSEDINRVGQPTQLFMSRLHELIHISDLFVPGMELPTHVRKLENGGVVYSIVQREGLYYIATTIDRIQYLCVARWNYTEGILKV